MKTNKFAPMGSALCFITECIVFCAIVEAAIRESGGRPSRSLYVIVGDDIIVETSYADAVIRRLTANGFTVNTAKTFTRVATHNFRESCGGEYIDGVDVTPVRMSRRFSGYTELSRHTPSRIMGCIDMANASYEVLPSVRRKLIQELNTLDIWLRPVFSDAKDVGLISNQPTNFHLRPPVWDQDYQEYSLDHGGTREKKERWCKADEDIRLYECLRAYAYAGEEIDDPILVSIKPPGDELWAKTSSLLSKVGAIRPTQKLVKGASS